MKNPRNTPIALYRFVLDVVEITILRDGCFPLSVITPPEMKPVDTRGMNIDEQKRLEYFTPYMNRDGDFDLSISPVLLDFGDRRILVDSGWNLDGAVSTSGHLGSVMEEMGVSPEDIDTVILTHGHPDHLGGLLHSTTQDPVFPNAEVVITDTEFAFWTGDDAAPLLENPILGGIPEVLNNLDDRLRLIQAGDEVVSGVQSLPSPGHTPGHISLGVEAGAQQLLITGDAIVNTHAAFEHPDWHNFFDIEKDMAGETRKRLLDRAATDEMLILGYHLPFPGVGYALDSGEHYYWYPFG